MTPEEARLKIAVIKAERKAFSRGKASGIGMWMAATGGSEIGRAIWGGPLLDIPDPYGLAIGIVAVVAGCYLFIRYEGTANGQ